MSQYNFMNAYPRTSETQAYRLEFVVIIFVIFSNKGGKIYPSINVWVVGFSSVTTVGL